MHLFIHKFLLSKGPHLNVLKGVKKAENRKIKKLEQKIEWLRFFREQIKILKMIKHRGLDIFRFFFNVHQAYQPDSYNSKFNYFFT